MIPTLRKCVSWRACLSQHVSDTVIALDQIPTQIPLAHVGNIIDRHARHLQLLTCDGHARKEFELC